MSFTDANAGSADGKLDHLRKLPLPFIGIVQQLHLPRLLPQAVVIR